MSNLLEIRNISKSFGHKAVLKDVTFNVPAGSIVGFIGDNGAGKSTTFKTILGLISQDRGKVKIFGKENLDKHIKFKEDIGVVFDAMNLPAHLTIKQLNHVFKKLFGAWDQDQFYRLVHSFSLPMDKKVNTFSRGMSMKLSVAVALSHNAKLLLLDEATGGLDPSSRDDLLNELKSFVSKSNGGILLSSHIMTDVEKIASHIIMMKDGEILLNEEKDKVLESYTVIDVDEGQLAEIDEDIVLAKRNHGSYWSVLVSDQQKLPNGVTANTISIEEISGDASMHRFVAMLIILFVVMPALEVIKYESKSGYDRYVLTLPVSRTNIVQSHYFFYLLIVVIGAVISYGIFLVYSLGSDEPIDGIFNIVSFGTFIVLFAGAIVYPLLYMIGPEKSDAIVIGGAMGGLFATFGLQSVVGYAAEQVPLSFLHINPSLYVPIIYLMIGVILYIISFFIAAAIYHKKEF